MRVRIKRGPSAGRVVILSELEALALIQRGDAEEDKMLDPPSETKAPAAVGEPQARGKRKAS